MSARSRFADAMVAWLNSRFAAKGFVITAETPLFARGVIDSLGILELIAWTEVNTGRIVPDESIRIDNFGTVERIAQMFVREKHMRTLRASSPPPRSRRASGGRRSRRLRLGDTASLLRRLETEMRSLAQGIRRKSGQAPPLGDSDAPARRLLRVLPLLAHHRVAPA